MLCIALFGVAESSDKLLARDVFIVGEEITLGLLSSVVDENVRISGDATYGANHVTVDVIGMLATMVHKSNRFSVQFQLILTEVHLSKAANPLNMPSFTT